ncbi:trehalase family glycosidase [Dongia soli]|uniref:Trehalase family glycosidase n=1 Tax=Dongia soli TaxID=600628 RepID=A0ABU5EI08_9PROT|nr:trehalase family glycosidase [Dongia soli]MDY0885063.1 trehalase family glycosidase [Dongia soli]
MNISPARHWNTWDSVYPLRMIHLPSGVRLTPCAYSSSAASFTRFPATAPGLLLGERDIPGTRIDVSLSHSGTEIDWRYDKPEPASVRCHWSAKKFGEWGLRVWVMLVLDWQPEDTGNAVTWHYDAAAETLSAEHEGQHVVIEGNAAPLMVTFHDSLEALEEEFRQYGYFYVGSRGTSGRLAVLRYNLDEMPDCDVALSIAPSSDQARRQVAQALAASEPAALPALQTGRTPGALEAIRDLVAWNTVWDQINRRPYTSLSRTWVAQKFGGFGVWLTDIFYHALLSGCFDTDLVRENLRAVLAAAQPAGNLPCLVTGRDAWIDRSQPPVCSFIFWMMAQRASAADLIDLAYPKLLANHDWWFAHRDGNGDGLLEWGTTPNVGDGLYRSTKLGAKNESSMDNSPIHDEAAFNKRSGTLESADVGLNSLLVLDGEVLAMLAEQRGDAGTAARLRQRAADLAKRLHDNLWDAERLIFANRKWDGEFVRALAPTSFYPMLAGATDTAQVAALLRHLDDPQKFGGGWGLPSVARDDPAYHDNVYWRGRIWPPLNFLTYYGLKRLGLQERASELAEMSCRLFAESWAKRQCPENFNADTGLADDQPDTDTFYGWGGLMPMMGVAEAIDVTPWHGWEITNRPGDWSLGPLLAFGRRAELQAAGGRLVLRLDGREVLTTTVPGRLQHLEIAEGRFTCRLPDLLPEGAEICLPHVAPAQIKTAGVKTARPATTDLAPAAGLSNSGTLLRLPATAAGSVLVVTW